MREYKVSIERSGTQVHVGRIAGETYEDARFSYYFALNLLAR